PSASLRVPHARLAPQRDDVGAVALAQDEPSEIAGRPAECQLDWAQRARRPLGADDAEEVLQRPERRLGREVGAEEPEVALGVAPTGLRYLVQQLVGVRAGDARAKVL